MHLFRWARFLSWKRGRRPSSPRRSSRWLRRHFYRSGSSRASLEAPSIASLSVASSFDVRPSMIYIEQPSNVSDRSSQNEDDRMFLEEFHRAAGLSNASDPALARVSSLFNTTAARSTIRERASVVNLFNQLQFEMPPPSLDPAPPDATYQMGADELTTLAPPRKRTRSQKRLAKRKLKKQQQAAAANASLAAASNDPPPVEAVQILASTEPSFFRQYMQRAKPKPTEEPKFRPLTTAQCRAYLQSVALEPPTIGSRGYDSPPESPVREPVEFLFFGGSSEENPHRLREIDAEPRRYRARYVAEQPTPSYTTSIHIKPTLVRGLPSVFEPRFESMYI